MKVWLYYRLSRDEDEELNSLNNQRKIIYNFAVSNGHEVVGESFDDNVSGMHFNREGIDKIYEVVEAGKIEAIIVKDLSRLGRHRTQTALFIDYLREHDVRVLSATENIDTFNENDDLIIGFKGLVNDFYARDGSRRVRTGYRQKQKEGNSVQGGKCLPDLSGTGGQLQTDSFFSFSPARVNRIIVTFLPSEIPVPAGTVLPRHQPSVPSEAVCRGRRYIPAP